MASGNRGQAAAPVHHDHCRDGWLLCQGVGQALGRAGVPCGPVLSPQQALDHPQVHALGLLQPLDHPGPPRPAPVAGVPLAMSASPHSSPTRAPRLGEHTDALRAELGHSADEIAALRTHGVV